jgi:hypothetical protein
MKKSMVFVFTGLIMLFVSGSLFAGGIIQRGAATQGRGVADAVDVAEVAEVEYVPRRNPSVIQASGNVYALPATPLRPEAERLPPPFYAVSGVRGVEIREGEYGEAVDIFVILPPKETFSRGMLEGEDVSSWIENLPAGLEARVHGVKKGDSQIKIYISGTPTVTGRDFIMVTIPGTYLTGGADRRFISPSEEESFTTWSNSQTE